MVPSQDGPDITNYWRYFDLQRDPFAMNADAELYFVSPKWEEILDLLQYISHYKNQIMLVTGDSGAGKSTLAELLCTQIADTMEVSRLAAEASFDVSRLIEFISDAFNIAWQPNQPLEQMLDEQLSALQRKDRPCLLVIDSAHLLPVETLEALVYLIGQQSEHQMHLHVMLLAETSVTQTFERLLEPSEEYLLHALVLEPLVMDETAHYLGHRLSVAGLQEDFPLTDEMITRIYRLSEGNPARINRIARRALLDMLNQDKHTETRGFMHRYTNKFVGGALVLVVLVAVAGWLLHSAQSPSTTATPDTTISLNGQALTVPADSSKSVNLPLPPVLKPSEAASTTSTAPAVTPSDSSTAATPTPPTVTTPAPAPAAPPAAVTTPAPAAPVAMAPTPKPVLIGATPPSSDTVAEAASPAVSATDTVGGIESSTAAAVPVKTVAPKVEAVPAAKAAAEKAPAPLKAEAKPLPYGLELLGVTDQASLNALMKKQPALRSQLRIVSTGHGSIRVFYGHYASLAAASRALTKVPEALSTDKLWPNKVPTKAKHVK